MSHVSGWVTESGDTVIQIDGTSGISVFFNTANIISLNAPGIYQITPSTAGDIATYATGTSLIGQSSISGASIASAVEAGVSSIGADVTGRTYVCNLSSLADPAASTSLTGNTLYGGWIGNYDSTSAVTAALPAAKKGMACVFCLNQGQASAQTMFVTFNPTDTVSGLSSWFSSGNSSVQLSGVTLGANMTLISWADTKWWVTGVSGHSYRNR